MACMVTRTTAPSLFMRHGGCACDCGVLLCAAFLAWWQLGSTQATITLPPFPDYNPDVSESISVTVPGTACHLCDDAILHHHCMLFLVDPRKAGGVITGCHAL